MSGGYSNSLMVISDISYFADTSYTLNLLWQLKRYFRNNKLHNDKENENWHFTSKAASA